MEEKILYTLKISLVGSSGAGKTTTLRLLCPSDIFLISEQQRPPTEDEVKAWEVTTNFPVTTSAMPNFGKCVFDENFKIKEDSRLIGRNDIACTIFDTCGQEKFYALSQSTTEGSDGILFLIDSSIPILFQTDRILGLYKTVLSDFGEDTPMNVVYNKQDIVQKRRLDDDNLGRAFYMTHVLTKHFPKFKQFPYFDASALEGWGINEAIEDLVERIMLGR